MLSLAPGLASSAGAVVAFSGTGQDFFGDGQASFPTGTPTVNGTSLDLPALVDSEVLAVYPLASAGAFAGPDPAVITYTLSMTRLSDDFDPVFLASDGTTVFGGQIGDNPNGSARAIEGTLSGSAVSVSDEPLLFEGAGFPAVGDPLDAVVEIELSDAESRVNVSFLGTEEGFTSSQVLDRSQELAFLVVANSLVPVPAGELYRLDALTLEIEVPEPTHALLFLTGVSVLLGAARVRKR